MFQLFHRVAKHSPTQLCVCVWLLMPTSGAKGMLYLLVQNVVSKNTKSLYLGYKALVLPSTQKIALTALFSSTCLSKKNVGLSACLLSKYSIVIDTSRSETFSRSIVLMLDTSRFTKPRH